MSSTQDAVRQNASRYARLREALNASGGCRRLG